MSRIAQSFVIASKAKQSMEACPRPGLPRRLCLFAMTKGGAQ